MTEELINSLSYIQGYKLGKSLSEQGVPTSVIETIRASNYIAFSYIGRGNEISADIATECTKYNQGLVEGYIFQIKYHPWS